MSLKTRFERLVQEMGKNEEDAMGLVLKCNGCPSMVSVIGFGVKPEELEHEARGWHIDDELDHADYCPNCVEELAS